MNPIIGNIITDIGAILQNKHVNMSNNNITRSYLGWGYILPVYQVQIMLNMNHKTCKGRNKAQAPEERFDISKQFQIKK